LPGNATKAGGKSLLALAPGESREHVVRINVKTGGWEPHGKNLVIADQLKRPGELAK